MHVRVNAATSVDGKLSTRRREQLAISGERDFERVYRMRAEVDAVVVGVGTVLADDPSLLSHDERHREQSGKTGVPARVVADSRARTPPDARILDGDATTYLLVSGAAPDDRLDTLRDEGAEIVRAGSERVDLRTAFEALDDRGVSELMVEGGGELIFSLFEADLVDELSVFVGGMVVGGRDAPTLADGEGFVDGFPALELQGAEPLDDGVLLVWDVVG
jgi:2,5-diamino-6-(ribosylamino)-4(3H)-pyrimidinone 5'-phosphate reductase